MNQSTHQERVIDHGGKWLALNAHHAFVNLELHVLDLDDQITVLSSVQ